MTILGPIKEGKEMTGAEFILRCGRMFGPMIHMRDENLDAPVRHRVADISYHQEQLNQANERVEKWSKMTLEEISAILEEDYQEAVERVKKRMDEKADLKNKYIDLMEKVEKWDPPTDEHKELKLYAIKQINQAVDWDCSTTYDRVPEKPQPLDYQAELVKSAKEDVKYYLEKIVEELDRVKWANKWIENLQESLKGME